MKNRLNNYNYMKLLTDWVGNKKNIFNDKFYWPRQFEIHLPSIGGVWCWEFRCLGNLVLGNISEIIWWDSGTSAIWCISTIEMTQH